jgi:hypothetical protein
MTGFPRFYQRGGSAFLLPLKTIQTHKNVLIGLACFFADE